jgi:hypothetical protein
VFGGFGFANDFHRIEINASVVTSRLKLAIFSRGLRPSRPATSWRATAEGRQLTWPVPTRKVTSRATAEGFPLNLPLTTRHIAARRATTEGLPLT